VTAAKLRYNGAVIPIAWAALLAAAPAARAVPLADAARAVPDAILDLRYATPANFLGRAVYPPGARCLLLPPVAERLARAAARLRPEGLRLRLYDCYRPLAVQREMWRLVPRKGFVADPARGSNHNRAAAVDVGLAAADGAEVELPTAFDAFEPRARADARTGVSPAARRNRDLLRAAMEAEGFRVNRMEWWHFDAPEARGAPVLDAPLAP
jgi:D-alanyl-D-alanine dipeptidase